ncbi:YdcH family protein [Roseibium sp. RKSG952]|uniref:YdcH family protein n=1 Tax=Roseibium sp. RKSG952 TaxID=2529384 RepID=UPI0012BBE18C|nr:YdcH family protein [Roseibium sp. RKSG952]MTH96083.1 DUF465 domain-containing protein [Roseibium sp. RKSG952]
MTHVPHQLHEEFPDNADQLHKLKMSDAHFGKLSDDYAEVNHEIHRIESEVAPASDEALEELKKKRLHLKDQIAALLAAAENTGS